MNEPSPPNPAPATRTPRGLGSALQVGALVFLRHPVGSDKPEYVRLREESEAWLRPWEPTPPPDTEPATPEAAFDRLMRTADTRESQRFLIARLSDGALVGQVSLNHVYRGPFLNAVAGYWIGAPYARRGYMREGLTLSLRHAFGVMGLHRVEANIIPGNAASIALVRGQGFRLEGLSPRYLRIAGRWQDHERWAMTAEEWPAAAGAGPT
jgi:[ribosomal protein S5]-alanine N-acetyltransferase